MTWRRIRYWWRDLPVDSRYVLMLALALSVLLFGGAERAWQGIDNLRILLGRPGLAINLGPALVGVSGILVAIELTIKVHHQERLASDLPGIRYTWRSTGWINASIFLAFGSAALAIAAIVTGVNSDAPTQPGYGGSSGWLILLSLVSIVLALTFLWPTSRGLGPRAVASRFLAAQIDYLSVAQARDFVIGPRTRSATEMIRHTARNPYTAILALMRNALVRRDEGLVVDVLERTAGRHLKLLEEAQDERERHWAVGAFFRFNDELLGTCQATGRSDAEGQICIMLSAWITETQNYEFDGAILTWPFSDGLAARLSTLGNDDAAGQVLHAIARLALEQLSQCRPTEPGQRTSSNPSLDETMLNHRFHDIAEEYRRFLAKVADSAIAKKRSEIARAAADGLVHMAYEARLLTNLSENQMNRWLTWILMDTESISIQLLRSRQDDVFGIPHEWQFLVENWPALPASSQNIPYTTYTRVMMAAARDGIAPWNAWNQFRIWLGNFAGEAGQFPKEALTWGATTLEDIVGSAKSNHKQGKLVGGVMIEVTNVLKWVLPRLKKGPHSDLVPRFNQV